jgi:hypothetical protein
VPVHVLWKDRIAYHSQLSYPLRCGANTLMQPSNYAMRSPRSKLAGAQKEWWKVTGAQGIVESICSAASCTSCFYQFSTQLYSQAGCVACNVIEWGTRP